MILRVNLLQNPRTPVFTTTAPHIVDPAGLLGDALSQAPPDLMRSQLQTIINALLSADADAVVGTEYGRPSPARLAQSNGYRHRDLDTRVGTIDVAIPKLRSGTYLPDWLLELSVQNPVQEPGGATRST